MSEKINASELAKRLEVTRSAVSKAVKTGRVKPDEKGLFDPEIAAAEWAKNTRANIRTSESPAAKVKASGYAEARARREKANASISELELARLRGELCDTQTAIDVISNVSWLWRAFVDSLPVHLAKATQGVTTFADSEAAISHTIQERMADLPAMLDLTLTPLGRDQITHSPIEREMLNCTEI